MKKENRRNILFRYGVIVFVILLVSMRIVYKLVDNTVLSAEHWNAKAEKTLSYIDTIAPVRGDILAADGSVLATNMRVYTPCIDFRVPRFNEKGYREAIPALSDSLAKYYPLRDAGQWAKYLSKPLDLPKEKRSRAYPIVRKVSTDDVNRIKSFPFFSGKVSASGFHVDDQLVRVNPYGAMALRSIGLVGETRESKERHGAFGLERALDSLLAGNPGYSKKVSLTSAIVDWTDRPPVNGYDVLTTIDIKMQDILENELNKVLDACKPDWGTAVLLEVGTGDIKAIVNLERSARPGEGYIESRNYAVERREPGSVIKLLSLMVAMEDGKVPDLDKVYKTGRWYVLHGDTCRDDVKSEELPIRRALEFSSNIVMSKMIMDAYGHDPGQFYTRVKRTGFLERFNTGIAEEVRPRIDSLGSKARDQVALTRQAFGYTTEVSPLYLAALYNSIAGDGRFVRPRLVRGLRGNGIDTIYDVSYVGDRLCSEKTAAELRSMLHAVVWGPRGTARNFVKSKKVEIAGKTGTAQMLHNNHYVRGVNRYSFCGFFPYDKPRYTCVVVVAYPTELYPGDTGISAAATSGRVVKNVAEAMYARGMLGGEPDYRSVESKAGEYPTYYATTDGRGDRLHSLLGGGNKAVLTSPGKVTSGVPDVLGLGLRDALNVLENAGYNVSFSGSGYVAGQTPLPGDECPPGTQIKLLLKE